MTVVEFASQALNYFVRPAEGVPDAPVKSDAAWVGPDMSASPERWLVHLDPSLVEALSDAADNLMGSGVELADLTSQRFDVPGLAELAEQWRHQLGSGTGVVALRGLPVRQWGVEKAAFVYWGIGHHIGSPGAQNPQRELLGHVKDYGEQGDSPLVRLYRTTGDIAFHCDAADVVGLMCVRTAKEGGQSRITSSVAVFNEIMRRRPDLAPELFEEFEVDRRDEQGPGEPPTFQIAPCAWDGQSLRTFWHSDYMRSAERHDGIELSPRRLELMDLYDQLANSEELRFDMWLQEGDIQLISNHTVVHSRTGYEDHEDPEERRHLLRLWLSLHS